MVLKELGLLCVLVYLSSLFALEDFTVCARGLCVWFREPRQWSCFRFSEKPAVVLVLFKRDLQSDTLKDLS